MTRDIKRLIDATEKLVEFMLEAHDSELTSQHSGDSEHDGEAPEVCSYCSAIDEARMAIETAKLLPVRQGKAAKVDKAARKLAEDVAKADHAIACLVSHAAPSTRLWWDESLEFVRACREEIERLERAKIDRRLLWNIYRRKDSGPSYVEVVQS